MDKAWQEVDSGLRHLMDNNDQLSPAELIGKSRRLEHLQRFVGTLRARVNERIRENVSPGPIGELFDKYIRDRATIDEN